MEVVVEDMKEMDEEVVALNVENMFTSLPVQEPEVDRKAVEEDTKVQGVVVIADETEYGMFKIPGNL